MAQIHLEQSHSLGLPRAREIAAQWMEEARSEWGMQCALQRGLQEDVIRFSRTGVQGQVRVSAKLFALEATLGFLLGQFQARIEAKLLSNLKALLDEAQGGQA